MKNHGFVLILAFVFISACKTAKTASTSTTQPKNSDSLTCMPIVKDTAGLFAESDPFLLVGAELKGKCLEIEVEYSGGCGGDTWTLAWTGNLMKSLPPKANIFLHLKDEDACRETVRKKVSFDISSVYNGEVILLLKDFRGVLKYNPD